jgi:hypothetical protein
MRVCVVDAAKDVEVDLEAEMQRYIGYYTG